MILVKQLLFIGITLANVADDRITFPNGQFKDRVLLPPAPEEQTAEILSSADYINEQLTEYISSNSENYYHGSNLYDSNSENDFENVYSAFLKNVNSTYEFDPDKHLVEVSPPYQEDQEDEEDIEEIGSTIQTTFELSTDAVSDTTSEGTTDTENHTTQDVVYNVQNGIPDYSKTLPRCPNGLSYFENEYKIPLCFILTESSFPPPCPYPNNIEYSAIRKKLRLNITNDLVWVFAMRAAEEIDRFRWIKFDAAQDTPGNIIPKNEIQNYENITNEHCLVLNGTQLIPENCSKKHLGICLYTYNTSFVTSANGYCKTRYNSTCVGNSLYAATKCYCKSEPQLLKKNTFFCNKLAEIKDPHEIFLLKEHMVQNEPCWIKSGTYTTNFQITYETLGFHGWSLQKDGTLSCAICEIDIEDDPQTQLHIKLNETTSMIELEIRNAMKVHQGIICFTTNDMKFINLTNNDQNFITRTLWNIRVAADYCWCRTVQTPFLTFVDSNKLIIDNTSTAVKSENLAQRKVCLPSITISGDKKLHWPETEFGATAIPEELCLQEDGSPVTRTCGGILTFASDWLPVNGTCAAVTFAPRTIQLDELLRSNDTTPVSLSSKLLRITEDRYNVTSFQVHLMSKVLEKVSDGSKYTGNRIIKDVVTTINNVMHFERSKLKLAQDLLNSTDMVLYSLDDLLIHADAGEDGLLSEVSEKLLVQKNNLKVTNIAGIKISPSETNGFDPSKVESVQKGTLQDDLTKENLELAMVTPPELYNDIINCAGSKDSPNIITSVFYDDTLFNEEGNSTGITDGRIISVVIPGFNCSFTAPIQIIFKTSYNSSSEIKCGSWVYGSNNLTESIHGHWAVENDPKNVANSDYQICEFTHVTHFSLLILGLHNTNISEGHKKALDIITAVGSGLSILGLLIVFLTAILFKSYRSANGVVINFSVAMTAQIVLLFVADNVAEDEVLCIIFGAALHYIVLSQFCWMLTIAILQYKRYVLVFSNPTTHLVAKTCAFAWGFPLLPVVIIVSISRDNYGQNTYGLCYALGNYFIFGVLLPVSIIVFINLLVFLRIMISIASSRRIKVHRKNDDTSILQLRLAFMLYFLLGLTWGFGLLAAVGGGIVYSYLFCLTATLQGFILFIFFIVVNERTRSLWTNMKTCCRKSETDKYDVSADSTATAMVRRARTTASTDTCTDSTTSEMLRRYKNRSSSDF